MVPATDSASMMTPARWGAIALGLLGCLADLGCAELGSFRQDKTPTLGSVARAQPGSSKGVEGDLYADRQRPNLAKSREALAQSQAKTRKPASPVPADDKTTVARTSETPASPEGPADPPASRPVLVALEAPVSLPSRRDDLGTSPMPGERPRLKPVQSDGPASPTSAPAEPTPEALVSATRARLDSLQSYQVTLNRQERVGEALQEPEEVLVSIKRDPRSVRLEWPSGPHKGREVIYLAAEDKGASMHIKSESALVPPIKMPVDNPLVLRNARHPITEAGFDTIVGNMEKTLEATRSGDPSRGILTYAGLENPGQLSRPCQKLVRVTPSGETWHVYIDPDTKLPAMVEATAQNGDLLERYRFSEPRVDLPELAATDAFAPDLRWSGSKGGLLQRLARSGTAAPAATSATR